MGDSDDEYDRKRRDKFRGERAEVSYRGAERVTRPRDDWSERDSWSRPRPRDYRGGGVRDRGYSPSMEPAPKRMRHDYYGDGYYGHYNPYHQAAHRAANFFREPAAAAQNESSTPPMMSFKAFLATQDDNISESEAIEKYNDYKLEFQRQQLNEFFVAHKDDEWFRLKYHPEESIKRREEQMAALKRRVDVFLDLLHSGKLDGITVDCAKSNQLLHLMDTVVVKLEGGTDEDLTILDQEYTEMEEKSKEQQKVMEEIREKKEDKQSDAKKEDTDVKTDDKSEDSKRDEDNGEIEDDDDKEETEEKPSKENGEIEEKDKVSEPENQKEMMETDDAEKEPSEKDKEEEVKEKEENEKVEEKEERKPDIKKEKKRKRSRSYSGTSSSSSSSSSDSEDEKEEKVEEVKEEKEEKEPGESLKEEDKVETIEEEKPEKPKALHKTTSIFLRNLAPTITKQEIEAICSRYAGFLRVALAEPQPERRWLRRGWVTFKRDANIKEICWNLNNIRLRDCELGAIVNRDLSRRIRVINGIMAHKQIVRSDINIASRVVLHMDGKAGLWSEEEEGKEKEKGKDDLLSFGLKSNNPVLHNITDCLIEEAGAEEDELLGLEPCSENQESTIVDRDDMLINVLDKIILYLRVVHSIDYYNHCEYPNEDEMPNRCGILHARGPPPSAKTDLTRFVGTAIENKMSNFLPEKKKEESKNEAKLIQLSLKDQDTEIDKFVQANTRELAKDKWLCPLSGKKFKGPDFVRKHIFNKHSEKIEEVKKEVEFFNNYLRDLKRPMLTDAPQTKREEIQAPYSHSNNYGGGYGGGYGRPPPYNNYYPPRARGYAPRTRGSPADYRPVIHYRDLDAPREPEEFI